MLNYYLASVSFGKDSAAMLLRLLEERWPLDEVVFYDTGMEFSAIYRVRDFFLPFLRERGIRYTELKPKTPFLYDMIERPIKKRDGRVQYGKGWCGGVCRWGTSEKLQAINRHIRSVDRPVIQYIGIAVDEPVRLERLPKNKLAPLAEWDMTEEDCLNYCRLHGIAWREGDIDLYDILQRVSCWCCRNKNLKELRAIWKCLPDYWLRLLRLQDSIGEPMKKNYGCTPDGVCPGDLRNLERRFRDGL